MSTPSHKIDHKSCETGIIILCSRIDFLDGKLKMDLHAVCRLDSVKWQFENKATAIPLALDGGLRQPKVAVCAILSLWGHGNQKTDTNIYYSTILSLYANTEKTTDSKADIR